MCFINVLSTGSGAKLACIPGWFEGPRRLYHRSRQRHERGTCSADWCVGVDTKAAASHCAVLLCSPNRARICSRTSNPTKGRSWSCSSTTRTQTTAVRWSSLPNVTGVEREGRTVFKKIIYFSPCQLKKWEFLLWYFYESNIRTHWFIWLLTYIINIMFQVQVWPLTDQMIRTLFTIIVRLHYEPSYSDFSFILVV